MRKSQANRGGQEDEVVGIEGIKFNFGDEPKLGIEREMRVLRVGPNPRMVVAEYWELAERRVVTINVRDNRKWLKGMRFTMREPLDEAEYCGVWKYVGKAPRRKGRW